MTTAKDIIAMIESGDKIGLHKHLGIKHYSNIDDFVKDYIEVIPTGDKKKIFNIVATTDELFPRTEKDFEKNGICYHPNGGTIKEIKQKKDLIRISFSTVGGFSLKTSLDTKGTPDFSLIFSLKENTEINVKKGDVIDFLGYTDDKLVLILKGDQLKVNNLNVNEIYAVKLHKKIQETTIDNTIKTKKPKL